MLLGLKKCLNNKLQCENEFFRLSILKLQLLTNLQHRNLRNLKISTHYNWQLIVDDFITLDEFNEINNVNKIKFCLISNVLLADQYGNTAIHERVVNYLNTIYSDLNKTLSGDSEEPILDLGQTSVPLSNNTSINPNCSFFNINRNKYPNFVIEFGSAQSMIALLLKAELYLNQADILAVLIEKISSPYLVQSDPQLHQMISILVTRKMI